MADMEVALAGNTGGAGGDTEIDLYADVVENDLETVWDFLLSSNEFVLLFQ